jgi:HEAT repeat protein
MTPNITFDNPQCPRRTLLRQRSQGFIKPWAAVALVVAVVLVSGAIGVVYGILERKTQTAKPVTTAPSSDKKSDPGPAPDPSTGDPPPPPAFPSLPADHPNPGTVEMNALIEVVKAGRPADRVTAAHRIEKHAKLAARAVPALLAALDGADPELEAAVLAALDKIGPPLHEYIPLLINALTSKSLSAQKYAAHSFAEKLPVPEEAIDPLVKILHDPHAIIRTYAARALERAGGKARPAALGSLVALSADLDPSVRSAASKAVNALGKPNLDDMPTLKPLLGDRSPEVRSVAMSLLGSLVTNSDEAAKAYVPLLTDMNPEIRMTALQGLIAYPDKLPIVAGNIYPLFKDADKNVRSKAIGAAAKMQGAPKLSDALASAFQAETDPNLHTQLADTFVRLADPKPSDVKMLRAVLFDCPLKVRQAAVDKLASLQKDAASAVDDLLTLANDTSPEVRTATLASVLRALAAIGADPKQTFPLASTNFMDKTASNDVRSAAVDLLASCGPDGLKVLKDATPYMLPDPVKAEMCQVFSSAGADAKDVFLWMMDTAETIDTCRPAVGDALGKAASDKLVLELTKRTDKYKTGIPGNAPVTYTLEYRTWALQTLGKMDLANLKPATWEHLETKMKLITGDNEMDPALQRLANVVLKKLKK